MGRQARLNVSVTLLMIRTVRRLGAVPSSWQEELAPKTPACYGAEVVAERPSLGADQVQER